MPDMRLEKLDGPAVWKAADLEGREDWRLKLRPAHLSDLDRALAHARGTGKDMFEITRTDFPLETMGDEISQWMNIINTGSGLLNVKGFPADTYSQTDMEWIYWGLCTHLGTGVKQNAAGDLLTHVNDLGVNQMDKTKRGYKSNAEMTFHSDGADVIGLMCLNQAKWGGKTPIASCGAIYNEILNRRPDLVPLLYENFVWDMHDDQPEGRLPFFRLPICSYKGGHFRFFYIGWFIRNAQRHERAPRLSAAQVQLLDLIDLISYDPEFHVEFLLEPGEINFVKNSSVLHMRTHFEDFDEPEKKRHMIRLWLNAHDHWADRDPFLAHGYVQSEDAISDTHELEQTE